MSDDEVEYESFPDSIFFGDFDFERYPIHEDSVLRPQLEREGFYGITFVRDIDGDIGSNKRVCICIDKDHILRKFVYEVPCTNDK
jgi:hypothetical protein